MKLSGKQFPLFPNNFLRLCRLIIQLLLCIIRNAMVQQNAATIHFLKYGHVNSWVYVNSCHNDWDEFVGFVTFAYNTSQQESMGVTTFFFCTVENPFYRWTLGENPIPVVFQSRIIIREAVKKHLLHVQTRQKKHLIPVVVVYLLPFVVRLNSFTGILIPCKTL